MIKTAHVDRVRVHLASEHLAVDGVDRQVVGGVGRHHHTLPTAKVRVKIKSQGVNIKVKQRSRGQHQGQAKAMGLTSKVKQRSRGQHQGKAKVRVHIKVKQRSGSTPRSS